MKKKISRNNGNIINIGKRTEKDEESFQVERQTWRKKRARIKHQRTPQKLENCTNILSLKLLMKLYVASPYMEKHTEKHEEYFQVERQTRRKKGARIKHQRTPQPENCTKILSLKPLMRLYIVFPHIKKKKP